MFETMSSNRNRGVRFAVGVIIALMWVLPSAGSAGANPSPGFCSDQIVRDYLSPLSRFSNKAGFSKTGKLAFGPAALRVLPPRERLVTIGRRGGFESRGTLAFRPSRSSLRWWAVSHLIRVGKGGGDQRIVKTKRQYIPTVQSFQRRNFGFGSKVQPGIYRLAVRLERPLGTLVQRYAEMFRAVTARSNLKLAADPAPVQPGTRVYLRVENYGTVRATYSYEVRIWRADGSELALGPQYVSRDRPLALPGRAGKCFQFPVPADAPAGEYRVGVLANDPLLSAPQLLTANFSIGPAS